MKRLPSLRAHLRGIVLATSTLAASGCCGGYDPPEESRMVPIRPKESGLAGELEACLDDDEACLTLCEEILRRDGLEPMDVVFTECRVFRDRETVVHMTYYWPNDCIGGRRPAGLASSGGVPASSALAGHFADLAHMEAASVYAFTQLARDLRRFGAPRELVRRALASAADEVHQTALTADLARAFGAAPRRPDVRPAPAGDLEALVAENVVEGCTRETYGALVATWQAAHARDPHVRAAMRVLADDETGHAELSAAIDTWATPRLSRAARARVARARRRAERELLTPTADPPPDLIARAGLPTSRTAHHLATTLFRPPRGP